MIQLLIDFRCHLKFREQKCVNLRFKFVKTWFFMRHYFFRTILFDTNFHYSQRLQRVSSLNP